MEFNAQELAEFFKTTILTVKKSFPELQWRALKQGYQINKNGRGEKATYEVTQVPPQTLPYEQFKKYSKAGYWVKDEPDEIWVPVYINNNFEVSNYGRIRKIKDYSLRKPSDAGEGYLKVCIDNKRYFVHRLVAFSFYPTEHPENFQVDHLDGNRGNNKLSNLEIKTPKENNFQKIYHRSEIQETITKLLANHSYEEILIYLQNMN